MRKQLIASLLRSVDTRNQAALPQFAEIQRSSTLTEHGALQPLENARSVFGSRLDQTAEDAR